MPRRIPRNRDKEKEKERTRRLPSAIHRSREYHSTDSSEAETDQFKLGTAPIVSAPIVSVHPQATVDHAIRKSAKFSHKLSSTVEAPIIKLDDLPFDVMYEISLYLMPTDLLHLSRVTTSFHYLLHSPSAESFWVRGGKNVPDLPKPFPGMSQPNLIRLLYEARCRFCFKHTQKRVSWTLGLRMCVACEEDKVETLSFSQAAKVNSAQGLSMISMIPHEKDDASRTIRYVQADLQSLAQKCNALSWESSYQFQKRLQRQFEDFPVQSQDMKIWDDRQQALLTEVRNQVKEARGREIVQRLERVGWGNEIQRASPKFLRHKLVNKNQQLTERVWKNIERPLLNYLQAKRDEILHEAAMNGRVEIAALFLRQYRRSNLDEAYMVPTLIEFCRLPEISGIIQQPTKVQVTISDFEALETPMSDFYQACHAASTKKLLDHFRKVIATFDTEDFKAYQLTAVSTPTDSDLLRIIQLATTVWRCRSAPCPLPHGNVLTYPQCLSHSCVTKRALSPEEEVPEWRRLSVPVHNQVMIRNDFDISRLRLHHQGATVAKQIVKAAGLNPRTTTADHLDYLPLKFGCMQLCCSQKVGTLDRLVWVSGWREMLQHYKDMHMFAELDSEIRVFRVESQEYETAELVGQRNGDPFEWTCVHCFDTKDETFPLSLSKIKEHMTIMHENDDPLEDKDYIQTLESPSHSGMTSCLRDTAQLLVLPERIIMARLARF